jgi:uncharacterized membrane protein
LSKLILALNFYTILISKMRYSVALIALASIISASPLPANTNVNPAAITSTTCTAKKVYVYLSFFLLDKPSIHPIRMFTNKTVELSTAMISMLRSSLFAEALQARLSNVRATLQTQLVHQGAHFYH